MAKQNMFCAISGLKNEADVEALFVDRLINKLRYPDNKVQRKKALREFHVGRGSKRELYKPDYVFLNKRGEPTVVVDAKSPSETPSHFHYQISGYALALNQKYGQENPVRFTMVSNGFLTLLYSWDQEKPILELTFSDFQEDNEKFVRLRGLLSYGALEVIRVTEDVFEFQRPPIDELIKDFDDCHHLIWKTEKIGPTDAFYEFAKIVFVKMREDQRIARMIAGGTKPQSTDFSFSVNWIREQTEKQIDDSPLANILFKRIRDDLEAKIRRGEKKRIFEADELLALKPSTIIEVVRRLEHYDLHGIDEDLNGRMFETFLNATVRGKELGQFFTPRSPVKYMAFAAHLRIIGDKIPLVFDGCCGSAGFLIEAMAVLVHAIDRMTQLTQRQREELKKRLYNACLWGIDANPKIAGIARLNMYLHGDGGSKIFIADTLDKLLAPEKGLSEERTAELEELRGHFITNGIRFDTILTNPPFSMSYNNKNKHEAIVLEQYDIVKTGRGRVAASAKSNVLFIERYHSLLNTDGQLLTVIDDTVLNGGESQKYRDYIFEHFILKQVISLPFNTFRKAEAGVKTSILHLKRREEGEEQGDVFMAILNNIGHDDHKRFTPERDNFPKLKEYYSKYLETGTIKDIIEYSNLAEEHLSCPFQVFVVKAAELNKDRIDAHYYSPELKRIREVLKQKERAGEIKLRTGSDYTVVPYMKVEDVEAVRDERLIYVDISAITQTGAIAGCIEGSIDELPGRARLQMRTNDVLFAKLITSRGINLIVPAEFDGQLATNGFIGIRCANRDESLMLWSILKSDICTKQLYYLAVTALQPELREECFKSEFLIPIPRKEKDRKMLMDNARRILELHEKVRAKVQAANMLSKKLFE